MPLQIHSAQDYEKFVTANERVFDAQVAEVCRMHHCKPNETCAIVMDMSWRNARLVYALFQYTPYLQGNPMLLSQKVQAFMDSKEFEQEVFCQTVALSLIKVILKTAKASPTLEKMEKFTLEESSYWALVMTGSRVWAGSMGRATPIY